MQVWNVIDVTNYLQALVDKSGIVAELKADGGAKLKAEEGYGPQSNVLRMLGYFSLVGLQRVHSLIGDYDSALKVSCGVAYSLLSVLLFPLHC